MCFTERLWDKRVQRDDEMSDSDDEGEGGRKFRASHAGGDVEMVISADTDGGRMAGTSNTEGNGNGASSVRDADGRPAMPAIMGGLSIGVDSTEANSDVAGQAVHTKGGNAAAPSGGVPLVVGAISAASSGDLRGEPATGFGTGTVDKDGDAVMD